MGWPGFAGLLNLQTFVAVLGYYASSFILYAILPATIAEGTELRSGGRLQYRMNAFNTAIFTLSIFLAGTVVQGASFPGWTLITSNYVPLLTSNVIISYLLATFVYIRSFSFTDPLSASKNTPGKSPSKKSNASNVTILSLGPGPHRELAEGGISGNMLYDWFIGRELNPPVRLPFIGHVDLKSFMELRPGMLGWVLLNLAFAAHQYRRYSYLTDSMVLTLFSQAIYVFDAMWNEPAILTTIDLTTDGFGFMLAFGDLVWLPFTYSLQARYLAVHPVHLGWIGCAAIFAVQGLGYWMFRAANSEKNAFRTSKNPDKDPAVKHLDYIQTHRGSKLLTSGWWGSARHINYLADWIMSWSYVLPTGIAGYVIRPFNPVNPLRDQSTESNGAVIQGGGVGLRGGVFGASDLEVVPGEAKGWGMLVTYFFMLYFAVLLIHRERRDHEKCKKKYGSDWDEYCRRVPSRVIPGLY